ncbi:hypothetical protein BDR26DRAFT_858399 [Obelidium mucronatum]|nr:hypothetical protein BDR26DRAFT_858399 [Obelidium mucronatum]
MIYTSFFFKTTGIILLRLLFLLLSSDGVYAAGSLTGSRYLGGKIFQDMVVQPIYWGQIGTKIAAVQPSLDLLYSELVKTPYLKLNEYGVKSVTYNSSVFVVTNSQPVYDDVEDIQNLLRGLVADGTIIPTSNTYFPLYLFTGSLSVGTLNSCTDFCYYRNSIDISEFNITGTSRLYYGAFPLLMFPCPTCTTISDMSNLFINSAQALVSAATNPSGTNPKAYTGTSGSTLAAGFVDSETGVSVGEYCTVVKKVEKLEEVESPGGKFFQLPPVWSQRLAGCTVDFQNVVGVVGSVIGAPA